MKTLILPIYLLFSNFLFGQIGTESNKYYESFLYSIDDQNYVHSIGSIFNGNYDKFFALEKSQDKDVTKAKIIAFDNGYSPSLYFLDIDYYDKHRIKRFLLYKNKGTEIDTFKYVKYNEDNQIEVEQYMWILNCGTGNPYDSKKIINNYDKNGKLLEKLIQTKWTHCVQPELSGIWIDHLKFKYVYDDKGKWIDYLEFSNLWKEGNDTIMTELFPEVLKKRIYSDERLMEEYKKVWDPENNTWVNSDFDDYKYAGDSIFIVSSVWNPDSLRWEKQLRQNMYLHGNRTDILKQYWSKEHQFWVNSDYKYYKYSGFEGYFDYFYNIWRNVDWMLATYKKYTKIPNGVSEIYYSHHGGTVVTDFIYDDNHHLIEKTSYLHWGTSISKLFELFNYYNGFGNIIGQYEVHYKSSGEILDENENKYFWQSYKNDFQYYLPLVDKDNEWNLGYWSIIGDTLSYVKNYSFSNYDIEKDGKKYKELLLLNPDSGDVPKKTGRYYYEENGKVWQYRDEGDLLLFDFALNKGDTFTMNNDIKSIVDTIFYKTMENGVERKVLQLFCFGEENGLKTTWVEGIGDLGAGIENNASSCYVGSNISLVCFHRNEELVYKVNEFDYCWPTAVDEVVNNKLTIVPNPATDRLNILTNDKIDNVYIFDISGRLVVDSHSKNIGISHLLPGLFIVKIKSGSKVLIGKFVKR